MVLALIFARQTNHIHFMKYRLGIYIFLLLAALGCTNQQDCENSDVENFKSFINLEPDTHEKDLPAILGPFTSGTYTGDQSGFIYGFYAIEDAPLNVVVNSATSQVMLISLEILSTGDDMNKDMQAVAAQFHISDCDMRFFGMTQDELTEDFGKPSKNEKLKGDIQSLTYHAKDYKTTINFKFYPEQDNLCTSVMVEWKY